MAALCAVCLERERTGSVLCKLCGLSYDRHGHDDGTVAAVIVWAARRARGFERQRHSPTPPPTKEGE